MAGKLWQLRFRLQHAAFIQGGQKTFQPLSGLRAEERRVVQG